MPAKGDRPYRCTRCGEVFWVRPFVTEVAHLHGRTNVPCLPVDLTQEG